MTPSSSLSNVPGGVASPSSLVEAKPTLEGFLTIQFVGKKKARNMYYCVLRGGTLFYKKRVGLGSGNAKATSSASVASASGNGTGAAGGKDASMNGEMKQIVLRGAQIRRIEEAEIKGMRFAIEVLHPERKIVYKIDYLYLIADNELDLERWYFALLTCCVPHNGYVDVELNKLLHDRFKYMWRSQETANWLSAIWARFHLNIRVSTTLRQKMINKLALRLSEKIEEKGYEQYIGNLQINDLDYGSKPPTIESVMIQPPDSSGDLIADIWLHYRNGDASLTLSCEVNFKRIMIIPISVTVSCKSLSGKLQLRVPPFPAERMSVSFYEEPTMDLVIEMAIGEKAGQVKNLILPKIKDIIISRLKLAIVERFVAPHRKYIRIPGTDKKDPQSDKPAIFAVKTSLKTLPIATASPSSSALNLSVSHAPPNGQTSSSTSKESTTGTAVPIQVAQLKESPNSLHDSSNSVTSDDDFANWSPTISRSESTTSAANGQPAHASKDDIIRFSLEASSSSSNLVPNGNSNGLPSSSTQQQRQPSGKLETATFEETVSLAPSSRHSSPPSSGYSTPDPQRLSTSSFNGRDSLAAELEGIGLAPVESSSSSSRASPSRRSSSGTDPNNPQQQEGSSRLSMKVKGMFRSVFPKSEPPKPSDTH